jgi:hypothetical protein
MYAAGAGWQDVVTEILKQTGASELNKVDSFGMVCSLFQFVRSKIRQLDVMPHCSTL